MGAFLFGLMLGSFAGFVAGRLIRLSHRDDWKADPPSQRQLEYARDLGIVVPPDATKGELSALIDQAKQFR